MKTERQITVIHATAILVSTIIGVGILPLPLFAVRAADTGAPLLTFLGMTLGFVGLALITVLGKRFPQKTLVEYSEDIIGKWASRLGSIAIIAFFGHLTAMTAREFGEVVITSVLKGTPVEVTVIVMLLLAGISSRYDMTTFGYIHYFYLPFLLVPVVLIIILSLKNGDIINLLPVWGNEPHGMPSGILTIATLFQGSFVLTCVIPSMKRPDRAMTASVWGMLIAGGLYIAIVAATVAVFGPEETELLLWPTLELAKTTSLPANILERLDAAFLAVWVTAVFTTLLSSYRLTIQSIGNILRLQDYRMLSFFLLPIVFMFAMQPPNVLTMYSTIQYIGRLGLLLTIGYPALLLLIALLRRKRGNDVGSQTMDKNG